MNNVVLSGRLIADPELKKTNTGKAVVSFCIAVDRGYKDAEGKSITDFINCTAWEKTAETIAQYLGKGRMIIVSGSWHNEKYQDKEGNNRIAAKCNVVRFDFCDSKPDNSTTSPEESKPATSHKTEEDLPF